ncbi:MAG: hemerythrin domain-containing protein [Rhodospirillaceae bacterium]
MSSLFAAFLQKTRILGLEALESVHFVRSIVDTARKKSARKAIWNNKKKRKVTIDFDNSFLTQLSMLDLGNDYVVHIGSIDRHHKFIVLMYNGLVKEVGATYRSQRDMDSIFHRLSVLLSAMGEHFIEEERAMAEYNYPNRFLHKKQHDLFLMAVVGLMDSVKAEDAKIEELVFYIGSWLSGHILISDKYFGEFFQPGGG